MALMPDGESTGNRHALLGNRETLSRDRARPPGFSYDPLQLDRSTALVPQDQNLYQVARTANGRY